VKLTRPQAFILSVLANGPVRTERGRAFPSTFNGNAVRKLEALGLVDRDPCDPFLFHITDAGRTALAGES
jgi:hypothetical protein